MGLRGLEPPTSRLSGVRSNHLSYKPIWFSASGRRFRLPTPCGGDEEDRTPDPLLARQVLSQLSYTPIFQPFDWCRDLGIVSSLFHVLKVHNLSIAPSKLNNDLQVLILIDHRIWVLFQNSGLLRKEVIQPHLPIRLPCYDFTLITTPTFGRALLTVRLRTSGIDGSHGVTGGVYKARERIHRGMLIRDY